MYTLSSRGVARLGEGEGVGKEVEMVCAVSVLTCCPSLKAATRSAVLPTTPVRFLVSAYTCVLIGGRKE